MSNNLIIHREKIYLNTARDSVIMPGIAGRYLTVFNASSYNALASVWINEVEGQPIPLRLGTTIREAPIRRIILSNTAQTMPPPPVNIPEYLEVAVWGDPDDAVEGAFSLEVGRTADAVNVTNVPLPVTIGQAFLPPTQIDYQATPWPVGSRGVPSPMWEYVASDASGIETLVAVVEDGYNLIVDRMTVYFGASSFTNAQAHFKIKDPANNVVEWWKCMLSYQSAPQEFWRGLVIPPNYKIYRTLVGTNLYWVINGWKQEA
ncbi:MAG: hypothetical protein IT442_16685 [Phycisphaeraceae bacterium]|nr:hypothetical protein [Phycisphaeraceae bacterium]